MWGLSAPKGDPRKPQCVAVKLRNTLSSLVSMAVATSGIVICESLRRADDVPPFLIQMLTPLIRTLCARCNLSQALSQPLPTLHTQSLRVETMLQSMLRKMARASGHKL